MKTEQPDFMTAIIFKVSDQILKIRTENRNPRVVLLGKAQRTAFPKTNYITKELAGLPIVWVDEVDTLEVR